MSILYFIIVLFVIVVVHEWGHYKTAKLFGIRVDEFGFGYPPKIKTLFRRGETSFTLNLLPFGGFVKIFGEDSVGVENADMGRALFNKPKWQQALVLVAGVFMNIVLAWFIFLILFLQNSPVISSFVDKTHITNERIVVTDILQNSRAAQTNIQKGDMLVSGKTADGVALDTSNPESFLDFIQNSKGEPITLVVQNSDAQIKEVTITPEYDSTKNTYRAGIGFNMTADVDVPWYSAIGYSFKATGTLLGNIFTGLFELIKSIFVDTQSQVEVSGPVGIVKTIGDAAQYGVSYILLFTALISLNLAALNILPIPALDGGRLLFLLIEKIKGKPINIKTATIIHTTSFIILVGLMLVVTFFDVFKLFAK